MARKCPAEWTEKGWQAKSTIVWPAATAEAQGSGGMSAYIQENEYAIGYIDAGHGHDKGLSEIALMNKDGNYLTTKQADIGAAATVVGADARGLEVSVEPAAPCTGVGRRILQGVQSGRYEHLGAVARKVGLSPRALSQLTGPLWISPSKDAGRHDRGPGDCQGQQDPHAAGAGRVKSTPTSKVGLFSSQK